jgi:hypothetical protein
MSSIDVLNFSIKYRSLAPESVILSASSTNGHEAKWPPIRVWVRAVPRAFLTPAITFYDGLNIPAAERARSRYSNTRRVHSSPKQREGRLRYSTNPDCSRFRQYPLDHDSSPFPPIPQQRPTADSLLSRTPCQTIRITSTLAGIAVMCVKYSIGD